MMVVVMPKKASIFFSPAFVLNLLYLFLLIERCGARAVGNHILYTARDGCGTQAARPAKSGLPYYAGGGCRAGGGCGAKANCALEASCGGQATTDPSEVDAVNKILKRWGEKAAWNISGDPCSCATSDTDFIQCDCTYNNSTICHITKLKVHALGVVGTIPEELQNLTYLNSLDLSSNYLTGPLPAFIGNLTEMQFLSFSENALSGTIPKELGKLQNLINLDLSINNFNGSLPSELGNLINLEELYINSCGVGGEFPSSVSSLKNLHYLWASDNNFTGKIPDFSETKLMHLVLHGNSFEGPIPSSFSSLTSLTDLRIGEISNGSSTLAFISNLTSLSTLVLRNSRISDTILDFSNHTSLETLDLSFNNITGQLPQSLFNLSFLTYLFLGNNSLFGSLPASKSTSLLNIDLSYNQLSGSFPFWVNQQDLKLNLVANNFVVDSSNSSVLPSGLNCLQRDKPCNRGSPIYYSFAIKCGGNQAITSSDGTMFESDSKSLTTASYYVTDANKWAVSSVGQFMDSSNADYMLHNASQFSNTSDSELYQTARLSPSSLRYYGLGLENGNYTIKLHFAETQILNPPHWESVGRRVFDIYIQGNLKEKDFDIRKEARETSFRAVVKEFTASVTNNFLEIHFFWSGKGTCWVPNKGYYGSSISAISVYPFDFNPTVHNEPPSTASTNKKIGLVAGIAAGTVFLGLVTLFIILMYRQRRRLSKDNDDDEDLLEISTRPNTFTYMELKTATEDFSPANKLGEGGFGLVFKGKLSDGRIVAVKRLSVASRQGRCQFMTEIATINTVQHRNLVKLYGCCIERGKRLLVYEYLENKSLNQALFGENNLHLDWSTRFEICLGIARGLAYLHEESRVRIVHRDVKASNILLDANLNPKISDFGLAKLYDDEKTHISTKVAGTIGYLAPEYAMRGHLTEKADVFGFGVVALEVLSGRPNSDQSLEAEKVYLLEWAWNLRENRHELEMVDPSLLSFNVEEAICIINVALLCTQSSPMLRPPMSRVVAMLSGDIEVSEVTTRPGYLTDWHFDDVSNSFASSGFSKLSVVKSENIQSNVPSQTTMVTDTDCMPSPIEPILDEVINEGG